VLENNLKKMAGGWWARHGAPSARHAALPKAVSDGSHKQIRCPRKCISWSYRAATESPPTGRANARRRLVFLVRALATISNPWSANGRCNPFTSFHGA
jgi:hypothetical protein